MDDDLIIGQDGTERCWWAGSTEIYQHYHDTEWGRPTRDDRWIFEKICLEGFQSGLSWLTILNKRANFRQAFANFDMAKVATFDDGDVERLVADSGIVRHRGKIKSTINNAKRALEIREEFGSLAAFVWQFEPDPATRPAHLTQSLRNMMSQTPESVALSKDLKKRGWSFVGPTTMYAFMQSAGIVNDHLDGCSAQQACSAARQTFEKPCPTAR